MREGEVDVRKIAGQYVTPVNLTWYLNDVSVDPPHVEEEPPVLPRAGDRLVWGDGSRYVVEEVWQSFEKHGSLSRGHHIFMREVTADEDRPQRLDPSYFTNSPS